MPRKKMEINQQIYNEDPSTLMMEAILRDDNRTINIEDNLEQAKKDLKILGDQLTLSVRTFGIKRIYR
jgi:hypothetical protein